MINQIPTAKIDLKELENFKTVLKRSNYTDEYFQALSINPYSFVQFDLPVFEYKVIKNTRFGILFHLFFLGKNLPFITLEKIFDKSLINYLSNINILEKINRDTLRSSVFLIPFASYYFASDFILQINERQEKFKSNKYDYVYPPGMDSITLAKIIPKRKIDSALDLGCGSGILSIIVSRYSKHVTGIDKNPRAVNFSRFNAFLNGVNNCQFLHGDLYKSVEDEKFDLIISNPPYEISFVKTNMFQDGGRYGYQILEKIIKNIKNHLNKNGFCFVITRIGQFGLEKRGNLIKKWTADCNFKIFYLELQRMNPYDYAHIICTDQMVYSDSLLNYCKYRGTIMGILKNFDSINLTGVSFGIFIFSKSSHFSYKEEKINKADFPDQTLFQKIQDIINMKFRYMTGYGNLNFVKRVSIFLYFTYKRVRNLKSRK